MRRPSRKADGNQKPMVKKLRDVPGVSVEIIHTLGHGLPDLLVGFAGRNILLELKNGERPCDRKLTEDEDKWHERWRGQVAIVSTFEEAMAVIGLKVQQ